jgi:hypothetical protein
VSHYYYGRFSRGFHAKDFFNNIIKVLLLQLGGGFIEAEDLRQAVPGPQQG